MSTQFEEVTATLRQRILEGTHGPGEKLAEIPLARALAVSRTPVRLALAELEKEGLVVQQPRRGFSVRRFSRHDVADAIAVRGLLEGTAARHLAEAGPGEEVRRTLEACLAEGRALLAAGTFNTDERQRWVDNNCRFHAAIIDGGGNFALRTALDQVARLPLASPAAILFDAGDEATLVDRLRAAHEDHQRITDAVMRGEGARAEALMREHAYASRENKLAAFDDRRASPEIRRLPGAELVMAG